MPGLAATLRHLAHVRRDHAPGLDAANTPGLVESFDFGANPGALRMLAHVPETLPHGAPLVVVLHGCTQDAAGYNRGAGWSTLADRHGFAVLLPEQIRANNANSCFNWFLPADVARDRGEAMSVRQMIARMIADHQIDPARVFITGLSAGGALTAAMLAAYPEVFAGGAIIAGLPAGAATSLQGALEAMFQGRSHPAREWGDHVRITSGHPGPWPRIQIWHGDADATVKPSNAGELVKQWTDVQGLPVTPSMTDTVDGAAHQAWLDGNGEVVLETFMLPGFVHGTPIDTGSADLDHAVGVAGPHMLEAGISSTWHIVNAFGVLTAAPQARPARLVAVGQPESADDGVGGIIAKALRAAGLLPSEKN